MTIPTSAVLYYHPDAYSTGGPKLMGRNAAGESFLRAYLAYSSANEFWAQVQHKTHAHAFADAVQRSGKSGPVRIIDRGPSEALAQAGLVYHPGPDIGTHAWQRAGFGHTSWSLCGITHTTASAGAMDAIASIITAPVQPWDALICTSRTVRDHVMRILDAQLQYLSERLGASRVTLPQLPVIPLGVHVEDFAYSFAQKTAARQAIGADHRTHVVLYMGRLSFHAKAHPLAMYQALEIAAKQLPIGESVVLVECGWHANEQIRDAFSQAARMACPSVRIVTLDGRNVQEREKAWASADVFCSLSDNIQETFGITPIEAMAAGLPVVVSDWDGYKDTVRDGVDGFRIPTAMPQPGAGADLAARHAVGMDSYDAYCGYACSFIGIDVAACANAFAQLFASPDLRQAMGGVARLRAREVFDWSNIIPRYEALWRELRALRTDASVREAARPHPWPARMDPFEGFASYATATLTPATMLALVHPDPLGALTQLRSLTMVRYAQPVLPKHEECEAMLAALAAGPQPAGMLVQHLPRQRQTYVLRAAAWLIKLHLVKIVGPTVCA